METGNLELKMIPARKILDIHGLVAVTAYVEMRVSNI